MTKWSEVIDPFFESKTGKLLMEFVNREYEMYKIYPPKNEIYTAFDLIEMDKVKVVILGQDPYHGFNQANGLAFSVKDGIVFPPSLRNIFKELQSDLNIEIPQSGDLTKWAQQGVFLLNTVLTVREGQAHSHRNKGWEILTDEIISRLSSDYSNLIFVLWGKPAQSKIKLIDESKHTVIKSAHPSPLSAYRGFFGSCPFSKINQHLIEYNKTTIDWKL